MKATAHLSSPIIYFLFGGLISAVGAVSACTNEGRQLPSRSWRVPIKPHPQEISLKPDSLAFIINKNSRIIVCEQDRAALQAAAIINDEMVKLGVPRIEMVSCSTGLTSNIIIIGKMHGCERVMQHVLASGRRFNDKYPGPEGYLVDVFPKTALVAGYDSAGTVYAAHSLVQLLSRGAQPGTFRVQPVTIIDFPDMPLRSAFYGFYLNAMEDDVLLDRAERDFKRIARNKFNMIDLASHHYGHLEMQVPGQTNEKLWYRFARLHESARKVGMRPRVGGWAKWVNTSSEWGADLTTLEGIRTSVTMALKGYKPHVLKMSNGEVAPNVLHDFDSQTSWPAEPVVVTNLDGSRTYEAGQDFMIDFGTVESRDYRAYHKTTQTNMQVLFSELERGEGEPEGYPLRWAKTFNPPTTIRRLAGGAISDGETVKIEYSYIGPDLWSLIKVRYCRSDARLHTDGPQNYIWRWCAEPVRFWGADDFALDVDETRVFAWDKRCLDSGKSRSLIWADDVKYYYDTIRNANPDARISMWSDMVDPNHNAVVYQTEEALSILVDYGMTDIIMIPWKAKIAEHSVKHFAQAGFPVLASCQGVSKEGISSAPMWGYYLRREYKNRKLQYGMMHCHWGYAFDREEEWEHLATVADHAWSVAPYIVHSPVQKCRKKRPLELVAIIEGDDYVFDGSELKYGPESVRSVTVMYRTRDNEPYRELEMKQSDAGSYSGTIPGDEIEQGFVEYRIVAHDASNTSYSPALDAPGPYKVQVLNE